MAIDLKEFRNTALEKIVFFGGKMVEMPIAVAMLATACVMIIILLSMDSNRSLLKIAIWSFFALSLLICAHDYIRIKKECAKTEEKIGNSYMDFNISAPLSDVVGKGEQPQLSRKLNIQKPNLNVNKTNGTGHDYA